jgi:hypothetical protein
MCCVAALLHHNQCVWPNHTLAHFFLGFPADIFFGFEAHQAFAHDFDGLMALPKKKIAKKMRCSLKKKTNNPAPPNQE